MQSVKKAMTPAEENDYMNAGGQDFCGPLCRIDVNNILKSC